jgi:type IV pilus biogenesis protein CpaD/CtpE
VRYAALALLLAGCATQPTVQVIKEPVEVKIPVPVTCISSVPPKPNWVMDNPNLRNADVYTLGLSALQELEQRRRYEGELETILRGCLSPS